MSNLIERRDRLREAVPHIATASGSIASFQTDMAANLKEIKIHFNPLQEGSGTPNPIDNIRPIHGWTGLDLWRTGKNLLDPALKRDFGYGRTIVGAGLNNAPWMPNGSLFLAKGTYTYSRVVQTENWTEGAIYDAQGNVIARRYSDRNYVSFTISESQNMGMYTSVKDADAPASGSQLMLETGSVASDYEPYTGTKIPVSWSSAGTIYGGWADPINGVGEATHIIMTDTWGNWGTLQDQGDGTELRYKKFPYPVRGNGDNNFNIVPVCNVAPYVYRNADGSVHFYTVANSYNCRIYLPSGTDTNLQIQAIGELITPIPFTFTPISPVKTLIGQNNIWSNANGDVDVKYWKH